MAHSPEFPISFELFPPRSDAAALALGRTIDRLAEVNPAFISVTFGAGGSTRDRSLTVLQYILEHTHIEPLAHLTCVGSSYEEASSLVRQFLDAGIRSFLALRGDVPADGSASFGDLATAAELVQLIVRVQQEREPFTHDFAAGAPHAARLVQGGSPVRIAVAAFPNGHPRERTPHQDIDALLAKQAAGADFAITQLFWRAEDYLNYLARARSAGVTIDIVPGIMPVTTSARLARLTELTGVEPPAELVAALHGAETDAQEAGVEFAARLANAVRRAGAPGLHLYTFNRFETVLTVLERMNQLSE